MNKATQSLRAIAYDIYGKNFEQVQNAPDYEKYKTALKELGHKTPEISQTVMKIIDQVQLVTGLWLVSITGDSEEHELFVGFCHTLGEELLEDLQ